MTNTPNALPEAETANVTTVIQTPRLDTIPHIAPPLEKVAARVQGECLKLWGRRAQAWMAWPEGTSLLPSSERSGRVPAPSSTIQRTRSTPYTCSVTPCSTCKRVFTSRK